MTTKQHLPISLNGQTSPCLYTPGSETPSRSPSSPFHIPMHLLDPETGEIHTLVRIPRDRSK